MHFPTSNGIDPQLSIWLRVRKYAVPSTMIETATERRLAGDWSGACAAAGFDADIDLLALTRKHGREVATQVLADLRHLAPDLLRWHLPRIAPDGLLRPGLTVLLARYGASERRKHCDETGSVQLVARTAPSWADAGQRIVLTLWDGADSTHHPHPRPDRRYRLDLHRHLWDARRSGDLRIRCGTGGSPDGWVRSPAVPEGCAIDRWGAEADILLRADGLDGGPVRVRCGGRSDLVVEPVVPGDDPVTVRLVADYPRGRLAALPVLPHAATWVLPDLALVRSGAIAVDRLHPLVAAALKPGWSPPDPSRAQATAPRAESIWENRIHMVNCCGEQHRIGQVDGALTALDHDPAEVRREELLVALGGTSLPCLQAVDRALRRPDCLPGVRERLDHGDAAGALAVVERLLGPDAVLRDGPLLDEIRAFVDRRAAYDRVRAEPVATPPVSRPRRSKRSRRARSR